MKRSLPIRRAALALLVVATLALAGDDPKATRDAQKERLAEYQSFVGQWRGVGQPKRGSARGAWRESSEWQWFFKEQAAELRFQAPRGKYFKSGALRSPRTGVFQLEVQPPGPPGQAAIRYVGSPDPRGKLVLTAPQAVPDRYPARISFRQVAGGDRLLVLLEGRSQDDRFFRIAELGQTRHGSGFGKGTSFVECVVTGGLGTIPVTFEGKTYYVCCSGCRDYFNENPAESLAEYRQRKEAEKKELAEKKKQAQKKQTQQKESPADEPR